MIVHEECNTKELKNLGNTMKTELVTIITIKCISSRSRLIPLVFLWTVLFVMFYVYWSYCPWTQSDSLPLITRPNGTSTSGLWLDVKLDHRTAPSTGRRVIYSLTIGAEIFSLFCLFVFHCSITVCKISYYFYTYRSICEPLNNMKTEKIQCFLIRIDTLPLHVYHVSCLMAWRLWYQI